MQEVLLISLPVHSDGLRHHVIRANPDTFSIDVSQTSSTGSQVIRLKQKQVVKLLQGQVINQQRRPLAKPTSSISPQTIGRQNIPCSGRRKPLIHGHDRTQLVHLPQVLHHRRGATERAGRPEPRWLLAMASNLIAVVSKVEATASNLIAMVSNLEAVAIAIRLEAIALRLQAIAIRL